MLHSSQQTSSDNNKHTLTSSNGLKIKLVKASVSFHFLLKVAH